MPRKSPAKAAKAATRAPAAPPKLSALAQAACLNGPLLLRYQRRWVQDQANVQVAEKSRRTGFTWITAARAVLQAASGVEDVWYVAFDEASTKEFIRDCAKWAAIFQQVTRVQDVDLLDTNERGESRDVRVTQIVFTSGCRINGLTSAARVLRGKQGTVIIDEAAFHNDLDALLKAAFALLMWGGRVWILSTHLGAANPFAQLVNDIRDGKRDHSLHRVTIKEALADGLYTPICLATGATPSAAGEAAWLAQLERDYKEGADEELHVNPSDGDGASYIPRELIRGAMKPELPVLRFEMPKNVMGAGYNEADREHITSAWIRDVLQPVLDALKAAAKNDPKLYRASSLGQDVGRHADLSVIAPMMLRQDLHRVVPFIVEMRGIPFNQQWQVLKHTWNGIPWIGAMRGGIDAGGNGSWIAEQAVACWGESYVDAVAISQSTYRDSMPGLKRVFESGEISIPSDVDVLADLALIRRVNGVPRVPDVRTADSSGTGKRHGDAAIAIWLANRAMDEAEAMTIRWDALSTL